MADGGGGANTNNNLNNPLVDDDTDLTINQDLEKFIQAKIKSLDRVKLPPDGEPLPEGTMGALLRLLRAVAMEQGMTMANFLRIIRPIFAVRKDTNAFINDAARKVQAGEEITKTQILDQLAATFAPSETTEAASQAIRTARKEPGQTYTAFLLTFLDMLHAVAAGDEAAPLPQAIWDVYKGMWMEGHEPAERELIKSTFMTKGGWKKASRAEIKAVLTLFDSDKTPPTTAPKTRRCFGLNTAEVDTEELQQRLMAIEAKVTDLKVTGRRLEEESRQRADDLSRNLQEATQAMQTRSSGPSGSFRCFGCGSPDHPLRFCPQRKDFYGGQRQKKQVQESEGDVRKLMSRLDKMEGEVDSLKEENAKMKKRLNEGQKEGKTNGNPNGGTLPRGTA
jgi:hypothetical protein